MKSTGSTNNVVIFSSAIAVTIAVIILPPLCFVWLGVGVAMAGIMQGLYGSEPSLLVPVLVVWALATFLTVFSLLKVVYGYNREPCSKN